MVASNKANTGSLWIVGVVFLLAVAAMIVGGTIGLTHPDSEIAEIILMLFGGLFLLGIALTCIFLLKLTAEIHWNSNSMMGIQRNVMSGQTQMEAVLTQVSENLLLSDAIKSVAFRKKDKSVLESAIRQDIRAEQWDSAGLLIKELETRFADKAGAEKLRKDMQSYCNASIQEKIDESIKHIDSLWLIHHYEDAQKEVDALLALYPDQEKVLNLKGETQQRRQKYKMELLDRWNKAGENNDVEQGVEILKLLDSYLTPTEAAALQESARGVFKAKLHNLGVQFSLFVTEKKWLQALKVGRQVINEFPNSRMAQEVREKLEVLEKNAEEQQISS